MRYGFNEIRVQFRCLGSHDLAAIYYLYSMPRGYRSWRCVTHEITAFCTVSGFKVSRLAKPDIILSSVAEILCQKRLISPGHRELVVIVAKS